MNCPYIDSLPLAIAIGQALGDVLHFDRGWAERVYQGDKLSYKTGPDVLNRELQSRWEHDWTKAEKKQILAKFVMYRLT